MKKFFAGLGIVALMFSANAKELKFGLNAEYPPFEYIDQNNNIAGFDVDLINELGKRLGFEVKLANMGFDALIPALSTGKINAIISAMSATTQRKKAVDFTNPYFITQNLYIKTATNTKINNKDDLKNKKVCVQIGTVQELASTKLAGVQTNVNETIATCIMALKSGKVDVVLVDKLVGMEYLKKNADLVQFFEEPDGSEGMSIGFEKNKHTELIAKINAELEKMKSDGSYDKLMQKHGLK